MCAGDGGIWLCGRTASSLSLPSVTPRGVDLRFRNASYKSVWPCPPSGRLSSSRNAELSLAPRGVVRGGDRRAALQLPFGVCPSRLAAASPGQRHRPFPGRGLRQAVGALPTRVECGVDGRVLPRSTRHPLPPPVSWASPGWCPVARVPCGAWLRVQGAATGRAPHPTLTRAWSGRDETLPCLRDHHDVRARHVGFARGGRARKRPEETVCASQAQSLGAGQRGTPLGPVPSASSASRPSQSLLSTPAQARDLERGAGGRAPWREEGEEHVAVGLRGGAVSAPVCDPVTVRAGRQPRACHRVHSVSSSPLPGRSAGFSPAEATTPPRSGRVEALLPWAPGRVGSAWTRGPGCGSDTGVLGAALTWVSWCGLDVGVMAPAQTQASWVLWVRLGRGRRGCRCLLSDLLERLTCHVLVSVLRTAFLLRLNVPLGPKRQTPREGRQALDWFRLPSGRRATRSGLLRGPSHRSFPESVSLHIARFFWPLPGHCPDALQTPARSLQLACPLRFACWCSLYLKVP